MTMSFSRTCSTYLFICFCLDYHFLASTASVLLIYSLCSGDEESSAQRANTTTVAPPAFSAPPAVAQSTPSNGAVERATDPRKQPSAPAPQPDPAEEEENDPDREFVESSGAAYQQTSSYHEDTSKGQRPNPDKHEDG